MRKYLALSVALGTLGLAAAVLAACSTATPTAVIQEIPVTVQVPVEVTQIVQVNVPMTVTEAAPQPPNYEAWAGSAHAKKDAAAFTHWDTSDPKVVPGACARCHTTDGYVNFVTSGDISTTVPTGQVITCQACHSPAAQTVNTVSFPSGATLTGLGPEARCMECHQGRASGVTVDQSIKDAAATGDDAVSPKLAFTNIHYFAASVARFGAQVGGGYQYAGKAYDVLFEHVPGMQACIDCHDPHSLQIKVDKCQACHTNVKTVDDLTNIRMQSSLTDYDGSGDLKKGIYYEVQGMQANLMKGMQAYATQVGGKGIVYNPDAYPYFFIDKNSNGQFDKDEGTSDNAYNAWTPRLVKAAYNYQTSIKDPGDFAHGGKYIIELLYDSLADLNTQLKTPLDMSAMHRIDAGHFAGSEQAFRHFDTGGVPGTCAKCHSRNGLEVFLKEGTNISATPSNGFLCENCHSDLSKFTRYTVDSAKFPSGAVLSFGKGADSNLCITCHQGRESTVSVNKLVAGLKPDEHSDALAFLNVHYFAAGATLFGDAAKGAYEFTGQKYLGQNNHGGIGPTQCIDCHDVHALTVKVDKCGDCHKNVTTLADLRTIRMADDTKVSYDGSGNLTQGIAVDIKNMHGTLYTALQAYALKTAKVGIVYDPNSYPYFFVDKNGDGKTDPAEIDAKNAYNAWTPNLLEAAYNYQYVQKDPGTFAHNPKYIIQVLYDSIKAVGGDVKAYKRPQ